MAGIFFVTGCDQGEGGQEAERRQFAKVNQEETPELAEYMQHIRRYTHKLSLSIKERNSDLADFYMHELQASALAVKQDVPGYEGYDIAYFTELMFDPAVDTLRTSLSTRNWKLIEEDLDNLVNSCNTCHNATGHEFINVTSGMEKNPYNQVFKPEE
ncbi:hypothetical protein [Halalkalibaculum sp. DA384]|uniref:hypothetical protein n=1 Tax=Halalkalibaculum sp. DA384 TaxID=3373606 RepID=UPI003753EA29